MRGGRGAGKSRGAAARARRRACGRYRLPQLQHADVFAGGANLRGGGRRTNSRFAVFLIPGKFVKVDLPKQVAEAQAAFPNVEFTMADALGFDERLADAVIESANGATADGWRVNLERAQRACRPDPQCPLYNTPFCPKHPGDDLPRLGDE